MRNTALVVAIVVVGLSGRAQQSQPLERLLTFETEHPGGVPAGWTSNPAGSAAADAKVVRSGGWSARLERTPTSGGEFTTLVMSVPLDVAGKSIVLRGFLRMEDVAGFGAIWLRQDGTAPSLGFDSTQRRQLKGTSDWQEHVVTVPIRPEGRQLVFGVILSGTGRVWVDDLELLVDGAPFSAAPKAERPVTVFDRDREFDNGSGIRIDALSAVQIDNLTTLGLVWGFLKYHHPRVTAGSRHWDYDLFRIMPAILASSDRAAANAALVKWVGALGPVAACSPCATLDARNLHLTPDLDWLDDETRLGQELRDALRSIHANRPAAASQFFVSLTPGVGNPSFQPEPGYTSLRLPDSGFQLLALYRFWNIVQYWFPYRDVIGEPWPRVLRESIPRLVAAKSAPEYHRALLALIARVHDTHANLWSSLDARPPVGPCQLPTTLRFVDRRPVVTRAGDGLERGDVVTALDGRPVDELVREWAPYYAASNEPTRLRDIARFITRGACGETAVTVARPDGNATISLKRVPAPAPAGVPTHDLPGETFRKLSDDVAYLKLSSIKAAEVPGYIEAAAGTKGLVVDIRNYPSTFVVFALGQLLVSEQTLFARFTVGDPINPGAFHWGAAVSLKPATPRYSGRVVILVDEISQSQAEYTAMAFRVAPGARVVGSTTAGADGNVSAIPLPGGVQSMISGIGVFYPDKRPTQRVGIVPDIEVRPTVAGIRDGRDEVLEAGIREIVGPNVSLDEIRKLIERR